MTHSHFQKAVVKEVQENAFILQFSNGELLTWQRSKDYLANVQVGDEVVCTLTRTKEVINELLESDDRN